MFPGRLGCCVYMLGGVILKLYEYELKIFFPGLKHPVLQNKYVMIMSNSDAWIGLEIN